MLSIFINSRYKFNNYLCYCQCDRKRTKREFWLINELIFVLSHYFYVNFGSNVSEIKMFLSRTYGICTKNHWSVNRSCWKHPKFSRVLADSNILTDLKLDNRIIQHQRNRKKKIYDDNSKSLFVCLHKETFWTYCIHRMA